MFNNLTIKTRLILIIAFSVVLALTLGALGLVGMQQSNMELHTVYVDRTLPLANLAEIKTRLLHSRTSIVTGFSFPQEIVEQHAKTEQDIAVINKLWGEYSATYLKSEEKILADKFAVDQQHFIANMKTAMELQRSDKKEEAKEFYFKSVRDSYQPASKGIDELIKLQQLETKQG